MQPADIDPRPDLGQISSQMSRQIVQLHARLYGRGPTRAKTYVTSDYALAVLEDIFTPAERTLIAAGKGEHVQTTRMAFQEAVQSEFVADRRGDDRPAGARADQPGASGDRVRDRALPVRAAEGQDGRGRARRRWSGPR